MRQASDSEVCDFLAPFATQERLLRIDEVIASRTRNLVLVLEDVHDPHNIAACIRSAEAMGLVEVHVVEGRVRFAPVQKIARGAERWIEIHRHRSPEICIDVLKSRGFTVAAGSLRPGTVPIGSMDFSGKVALAFGNEHDGLSDAFLGLSDLSFHIPMLGFTRSFNISVSAALGLSHAVNWRVSNLGGNGDLSQRERTELRARWLRKTVFGADYIVERGMRERGSGPT